MAIEIPHDVALFLNYIGVPYPDINEDQVRALARHVRNFSTGIQNIHNATSSTVKNMGSVYSGYSYSQLVAAWSSMSKNHYTVLDEACRLVAKTLDAAAEVIKAVKIAVLAELAALTASYAAAMAATVVTDGLSAAIEQAITAAARKVCEAMEQAVISYLLSEVIGKAIEPLEHSVDRLMHGLVNDAANHLLAPPSASTEPLYIEPDEVSRYAKILDQHADDILALSSRFADQVAGLDFISPITDNSWDSAEPTEVSKGIDYSHNPEITADQGRNTHTPVAYAHAPPTSTSTPHSRVPSSAETAISVAALPRESPHYFLADAGYPPEEPSKSGQQPMSWASGATQPEAAVANQVPANSEVYSPLGAAEDTVSTEHPQFNPGITRQPPGTGTGAVSSSDRPAGDRSSLDTRISSPLQHSPDNPLAAPAPPRGDVYGGGENANAPGESEDLHIVEPGSGLASSSPWLPPPSGDSQRRAIPAQRSRTTPGRKVGPAATNQAQLTTPWSSPIGTAKSDRKKSEPKVFAPTDVGLSAHPSDPALDIQKASPPSDAAPR